MVSCLTTKDHGTQLYQQNKERKKNGNNTACIIYTVMLSSWQNQEQAKLNEEEIIK